jgi:WD40 repeat protein
VLLTIVVLAAVSPAQEIQPKFVLTGHKDTVLYILFSPDGKSLLTTGRSDQTMRLWDTTTGLERRVFTKESELRHPVFTPDGKIIATKSTYPRRIIKRRKYSRGVAYYPEDTVELWDLSTGVSKEIFQGLDEIGNSEIVFDLAISPDGASLVFSTAAMESKLYLWDLKAEKLSTIADELPLFIQAFRFSSDGSTLAVPMSGDISLLDTSTWKERATLKHAGGSRAGVDSLSFTPDGRWLASAGRDSVRIWYLGDSTLFTKIEKLPGALAVYSPDGLLLAVVCHDGTLRVFDTRSYEHPVIVKAHDRYAACVAFSPDGKLIATGSTDRKAKLWETAAFVRAMKAQQEQDRDGKIESTRMKTSLSGRPLKVQRKGAP